VNVAEPRKNGWVHRLLREGDSELTPNCVIPKHKIPIGWTPELKNKSRSLELAWMAASQKQDEGNGHLYDLGDSSSPNRIEGLLFTCTTILKVRVNRDYDGFDECIVNMTRPRSKSGVLFSWCVMRRTWDLIHIGKITYNAVLEVLLSAFVRWNLMTLAEKKIQKAKILPYFIDAAMCFVLLQRIDYPNVMPRCLAKTTVDPATGAKKIGGLIGDAVALGTDVCSSNLDNFWRPTPKPDMPRLQGPTIGIVTFLPCCMIADEKERQKFEQFKVLLQGFSGHSRFNVQTGKTIFCYGDPVTEDGFQEIILSFKHRFSLPNEHPIHKRLGYLERLVGNNRVSVLYRKSTRFRATNDNIEMIQALVCDYPVCGLVPANGPQHLEDVLKVSLNDRVKLDDESSKLLSQLSPVVWRFIKNTTNKFADPLPEWARGLLTEILAITNATYSSKYQRPPGHLGRPGRQQQPPPTPKLQYQNQQQQQQQ
jgi:hypothetical protein